jgi:hypothetical protein
VSNQLRPDVAWRIFNQPDSRQRPGPMAKDDGKVWHEFQPAGSRVPVAVGKLLENTQELVSPSMRACASWVAALGEYSGVIVWVRWVRGGDPALDRLANRIG